MYKIQLLDGETKTLNSEQEFVDWANKVAVENNDSNFFAIHNEQDAKDYIAEYCPNLILL